jgi:predicted RNA-binding Zn-ribbon protein involved in translation (DUF1610 family)
MPKVDIRELPIEELNIQYCSFCGYDALYINDNGLLECDECGELALERNQPFRKTKEHIQSKKYKNYE